MYSEKGSRHNLAKYTLIQTLRTHSLLLFFCEVESATFTEFCGHVVPPICSEKKLCLLFRIPYPSFFVDVSVLSSLLMVPVMLQF